MPKILWTPLDKNIEDTIALGPFADAKVEDARIEQLEAAGFQVVWRTNDLDELETMGARLAKVRVSLEGRHWSMERAVRKDGYARLAPKEALERFSALVNLLAVLDAPDRPTRGTRSDNVLEGLRALAKRTFSAEHLAALETVARLGSRESLLAFLKADV